MPTVLIVLFIVSVLPIVFSAMGGYFRVKQFGRFDNDHPRLQQAQLVGTGARAMAAHANAWEALMVFSVVVFIAYAAGVDLTTLTVPALIFLFARVAYGIFYVAGLATLRSLTFAVGMGCCIYIFYRACVV